MRRPLQPVPLAVPETSTEVVARRARQQATVVASLAAVVPTVLAAVAMDVIGSPREVAAVVWVVSGMLAATHEFIGRQIAGARSWQFAPARLLAADPGTAAATALMPTSSPYRGTPNRVICGRAGIGTGQVVGL